jgi:DNA gyrase subunit B
MSEEIKKDNYSADSIQALEGMEHVRMRPSMYIGDVGFEDFTSFIYEVVDNSIDEAMGGYCDTIIVISMKMDLLLLKIMVVVFR